MDVANDIGKPLAPCSHPCGSCPYRQDVPGGVWSTEEYEKLPHYDKPTAEQPMGLFLCHQQNGHLCAGWAGTHDMDETLSIRLAVTMGTMHPDEIQKTIDYESPVSLWESGQEAHDHGVADVSRPSYEAKKIQHKLMMKRERKEARHETHNHRSN